MIFAIDVFHLLVSVQHWQNTGPSTKAGGTRGAMVRHFFWNRAMPGMFSWKFTFLSFSNASNNFLAHALPESRRGSWNIHWSYWLWFFDQHFSYYWEWDVLVVSYWQVWKADHFLHNLPSFCYYWNNVSPLSILRLSSLFKPIE